MMRRLAPSAVLALLLLTACRSSGPLKPEEVLQKATAASAQLQSAAYDVQLTFAATKPMRVQGNASLKGVLAHGGQQTSFSLTLHAAGDQGGVPMTADVMADLVSDAGDVYVQLRSLTLDPSQPFLKDVASILNIWWKMPHDAGGSPMPPVTPDPQFLKAEAAVVRVEKDHGLEEINGRSAYHYTVSLDHDRLIALLKTQAEQSGKPFDAKKVKADLQAYDATGELWIDAETFVVHSLSWKITDKKHPEQLTLSLSVSLTKHNEAQPVTVPSMYKDFHPETLLQYILPAAGSFSL